MTNDIGNDNKYWKGDNEYNNDDNHDDDNIDDDAFFYNLK